METRDRPAARRRWTVAIAAAVAVLGLTGCGDNLKPPEDEVDANPAVCGNNLIEPGEDCDDGDTTADMVCDARCHFTCGNGVVDDDQGEICDTGIGSGTGACPTTCNDGMACTDDVLSASGCQATCVNSPITAAADDDGCCPPGANANTDNDCTPTCGNGALESGEGCDTGIPVGGGPGTGACPTACDDGHTCTIDTLEMGGTCAAVCTTTDITFTMTGDGCCPPGATPAEDGDCVAGCGNGVVDAGETCDTAITTGPGVCPTACDDGMACTLDQLVNGDTCTATCTTTDITVAVGGDGCCAPGANANTDGDCAPVCGNMEVEPGEECDDGNLDPNDGCNLCALTMPVPTAFRIIDLDLRDPHIFVDFVGCRDITDMELGGFSVNGAVGDSLFEDANIDGYADLAPTLVYRPFIQAPGAMTPMELHLANCTVVGSLCSPGTQPPFMTMNTNGTGTAACLTPLPGTTTPRMPPYTPGITNPAAPCFASDPTTVTLVLTGISIRLHDARIAATYVGNPANQMVNGIIAGFVTESDADTTILPSNLPLVGGKSLSTLLPGGDPPGPDANCAAHDDRDMNVVSGWWFYINFVAQRVPWSDN